MLIQGITIKDIVTTLKLHRNTIYNWKQNEEFQKRLQKTIEQKFKLMTNMIKRDAPNIHEKITDLIAKHLTN